MKELKFFGDELAVRYGRKLQRIPLDLAFGCPNRENGYGPGCVFCAENGSRARHLARHLDLASQVERGVAYVRERYRCEGPYIAYFQSFTSTFAPVERLRECFETALARADFKVVIVGTRPDALEPDKVEYLRELASRYELWVELGVQSASDETLRRIKRGHDFAAVEDAAHRLEAAGINCACHVILGLPGEGPDDFLATARRIAKLPFRAVKLHQLLVLKHTELAKHWQGELAVKPLNEYEYAAAAAAFLRELPDSWSIMRLAADADESEILAPRWWMDKGQFLEFFAERFRAGDGEPSYCGVATADGSRTLYHPEFRQLFHSLAGAESEARHKFIEPTRLAEKKEAALLDLGFGLGINALEALRTAAACGNRLEIDSFELDERPLRAALGIAPADSEAAAMLRSLLDGGEFIHPGGRLTLHFGDARTELVKCRKQFDAVFLDAFSPDCNPELWTLDFLAEINRHCRREAILATYS
ncbi:MAG: TIGR01212 family radical SAM protein, partial [Victivallaceae bacterium]